MNAMRRLQTIIAIALAVACAGAGPWPQRDAFYGEVHCGLSIESVRSLVERYEGDGWICHDPAAQMTECSFMAGRTRVTFEFEDGKIRTIEDGDQFGVTGMATRPKVGLCSGARSRSVMIVPRDDSWIGAAITVNGQSIGVVTAGHAQGVYVPLGRYVLNVDKAGREPLKLEINVPDGTLREPPTVKLP
jgi:hypothetical protein